MSRPTVAKINLANIKHNFNLANQLAPNSNNMAVIKANAYGHGLLEVAKCLQGTAPAFCVAIIEEAVCLREGGIKEDILVFQGVNSLDELKIARQYNLWVTIYSYQQLKLILSHPSECQLQVWLKIDTGMHRLGLNLEEFIKARKLIKKCGWIKSEYVVSSHFSCANELKNDESITQLTEFNNLLKMANEDSTTQLSMSNSSAMISIPQANYQWNRPGILLYGLPLFDEPHSSDKSLKPAMSFESQVIAIREVKSGESVGYGKGWTANKNSQVATVAVGYADGYPKQAKNGTPVLVKGKRARLVGAVSMDLLTIDVSDIQNVSVGDKVELWGTNLCANEVATWSGTIGYDLITGISHRVPRIYI